MLHITTLATMAMGTKIDNVIALTRFGDLFFIKANHLLVTLGMEPYFSAKFEEHIDGAL